jgi:hypothetical protein
VGIAPTGKAPPFHGARQKRTHAPQQTSSLLDYIIDPSNRMCPTLKRKNRLSAVSLKSDQNGLIKRLK